MSAVQLYNQPEASTEEQKTRDLLWGLYEDASNCFHPSFTDRGRGLVILADLLAHESLRSHDILRAMAHILIAVNSPYDIDDDCAVKMQHVDAATQVLKDLKDDHGVECQGCALVQFRVLAKKGVDKWENEECTIMKRLTSVCESERKAIEDWNWEFAPAKKRVTWADEVGDDDGDMPGLV